MKKVIDVEYPWKGRLPRDRGSSKRNMLKLETERTHVGSVGVHEEKGVPKNVSLDYNHLQQIEIDLLEVERKKAKALMEIERQRMRMF